MRFLTPEISKYDIRDFIKENWDEIIDSVLSDIEEAEEYGIYEKKFVQELKKYELDFLDISLKEEFKENDEQQE